jgi:integrase/recombinase XerD
VVGFPTATNKNGRGWGPRRSIHKVRVSRHFMFVFESIYAPEAVDKQVLAPLPWAREQFLVHLHRRGTGRITLRSYASALNQIVRFLKLKRLRRVRVSEIERAARRWARYTGKHRCQPAGPWSEPRFIWIAKRWLKFHGKLVLHSRKVPFGNELNQYAEYMRAEGQLAPATVQTRIHYTRRFLSWFRRQRPPRRLSAIRLSDVDRYFAVKSGQWASEITLSSCAVNLRPFFFYAEKKRWCGEGIAGGIKLPPRRTASFLPGGPRWTDVKRLLGSTQGTTPVAIRAKAILLLLAFYGLRRGEIVQLRLKDIDWQNGTMTVRRSKRGRIQQFPLRSDVSEAVRQYIYEARPRSPCEHVFLGFQPPFGPIGATRINHIVSTSMKRLGIYVRRGGPHSLRHACATELLNAGAAPEDVADFLGHRTLQCVGVYAKYDLMSLGEVSDLDLTGAL